MVVATAIPYADASAVEVRKSPTSSKTPSSSAPVTRGM